MKFLTALAIASLAFVCAGPPLRAEKAPPTLYAQVLVDWVMAKHPELEHCTLHAIYPGRPVSSSGLVGVDKSARAGDEDDTEDFAALTTGKDNFSHYQKHNKDLWKAIMPLFDRKGIVIGELTLRQQYTTKDGEARITESFQAIRDNLKIRIPSQKSLFETGKAAGKNYAQSLIDNIMATHAGIELISLHAFAPGAAVMTSCAIAGSHPEKAGDGDDEEDFAAYTTGKPNFYQTKKKDLFKCLLLVNDIEGRQVGMVVIRYPYTTKEEEPKQQEKMEAIRNWLQLHIPSKEALYETVAD